MYVHTYMYMYKYKCTYTYILFFLCGRPCSESPSILVSIFGPPDLWKLPYGVEATHRQVSVLGRFRCETCTSGEIARVGGRARAQSRNDY